MFHVEHLRESFDQIGDPLHRRASVHDRWRRGWRPQPKKLNTKGHEGAPRGTKKDSRPIRFFQILQSSTSFVSVGGPWCPFVLAVRLESSRPPGMES